MNMKLNEEETALLLATAQIHGMSGEQAQAMLTGMACMVAEHEVMKARLVELEEITDTTPTRWRGSGEPIINLKEVIQKHMTKMGK